MSKKRYSSKSSRGSSYQGHSKSTSTQQSNYEESLTAECLIRTFMEKGNMEDPILKMLFIGGSKPKDGETEYELLFRRMKNCWLDRSKNYGAKEFLKAKFRECQLDGEVDSKWAKYSMMGAQSLLYLKFGLINKEKREDFQKIFKQIFKKNFFFKYFIVMSQLECHGNFSPELVLLQDELSQAQHIDIKRIMKSKEERE